MNPPQQSVHIDLPSGRFRPARWGARLSARILDGVIVGIPVGVLAVFILAESTPDSGYSGDSAATVAAALLIGALAVAVEGLYEIAFVAASGSTPGKRVLGLRIVNADVSSPPRDGTGTEPAFTRWAVLAIPGVLSGGLWLLPCAVSCLRGGAGRQGWHDRAARTYVIAER
ncbi:RDD family protein [Nocardia sp. CDC160]|uniref:RDD family protein n=1 Tax=Nocardia sp. CDC160 TaxID=3112166 RepID=UPI002DBDC869|nr:RDD family protein [Nocardia sp. CDC160]MEC3918432.1 RDD family protein [Nocardia sp. CDC160]